MTTPTIAHRFSSLIEALNLNVNQFAKSIGKPRNSIQIIVDGKSKPGYELLEAIFQKYPDVSRDWLMVGEGSMFTREQQAEASKHFGEEIVAKIESYFREQLKEKDEQLRELLKLNAQQAQAILNLSVGKPEGAIEKPLWPEEVIEIGTSAMLA